MTCPSRPSRGLDVAETLGWVSAIVLSEAQRQLAGNMSQNSTVQRTRTRPMRARTHLLTPAPAAHPT